MVVLVLIEVNRSINLKNCTRIYSILLFQDQQWFSMQINT